MEEQSFILNLMESLLIGVLIALVVFLFFQVFKLKIRLEDKSKEIERLNEKLNQLKYGTDSKNWKPAPPERRKPSTPELRKIDELQTYSTSKIKGQDDQIAPTIDFSEKEQSTSMVVEQSDLLYFPAPSQEGQFYMPDGKNNPERESLYVLSGGEFKFYESVDSEQWKMVLDYEESYIRPVCQIDSAKEDYHRLLITTSNGEYEMQGNEIIVKKKMRAVYG